MKKVLWTAACATLLAASPVLAQRPVGIQGIGPRFGVTINPDQVHVGGQLRGGLSLS